MSEGMTDFFAIVGMAVVIVAAVLALCLAWQVVLSLPWWLVVIVVGLGVAAFFFLLGPAPGHGTER